MEIGGKDDYVARWVQGICAIPFFIGVIVVILVLKSFDPEDSTGYFELAGLGVVLVTVLFRCVWYAITGGGNINRDVMDDTNVGGDRFGDE